MARRPPAQSPGLVDHLTLQVGKKMWGKGKYYAKETAMDFILAQMVRQQQDFQL